MEPILIRDAALRAHIARDGFSTVPLLTSDDIAELLAVYREASPPMAPGFYTTLWSEDRDYREKAKATITRVLHRRLAPLVGPAKVILTQFAVKQGGRTGTECPLHQDWSMCDEARHESVSVWCPLIDVDATNGMLAVVPGSHRVADRIRPNMPSDFYYSRMSPLYEVFRERYLRELPTPAGHGVLYHGALTHGSRPNQGGVDRVAVVASLVSPATPVMHYWMPAPDTVEAFQVEDEFYTTRVALGRRPEGAPVETIAFPHDRPPVSEQEFVEHTSDTERNPVAPQATASTGRRDKSAAAS